jgi:hypothetical protein
MNDDEKGINRVEIISQSEKLSQQVTRYVDAPKLLELLFDEDSRPSLRWLREQQKNRTIPFCKIGRKVFFDPQIVKLHFDAKSIMRN